MGNFDGLHLGHKELLKNIRERKSKLKILVMTFIPHPLEVIKNIKHFLINTYDERREFLKKEGVDFLFEIPFCKKFSLLESEEFTQKFLCPISGLKKIFVGYDSSFGTGKSGDVKFLMSFFQNTSVAIEHLEEKRTGQEKLSSTEIRNNLPKGDIEVVNKKLGREYFIGGIVKKGKGRGKRIGIPTININYHENLLLPKNGVYATRVLYKESFYDSITNIGINPTFNDKKKISIETHILDFKKDVYGENIRVFFLFHLRDEIKFSTPKRLINQIKKDIERRRSL